MGTAIAAIAEALALPHQVYEGGPGEAGMPSSRPPIDLRAITARSGDRAGFCAGAW